jgi:MFS transporter, ACS family, tartrate transporter
MRERALAMSGLIVAVPFSLAIGALLSALLLDVGWHGLAGWQWLFIFEGLPAVVMGVVTLFAMTDRRAK